MALIRDNEILSWEEVTNSDRYLRNKDAPLLADDPIMERDIRSGMEVVSRSGNVMPRAITRDKLGDDALLQAMNLNLDNTIVVQVATGYDKALNYYIYAVTWDGVNYKLLRFNTLNLLSPYQDAFSVNIPTVAQIDDVLGVVVLTDKVMVLVQATNVIALFYNFDLNYLSQVNAQNFAYDVAPFRRNLTYDGQYLVHSVKSTTRIRTRQLQRDSWQLLDLEGTANWTFQTFTPVASAGPLRRVGAYLRNTTASDARVTFRIFRDSTILDTSSAINLSPGFEGWVYWDTNVSVTTPGQYAVACRGPAGGSGLSSPDWAYKNSDVYSGGFLVISKVGNPGSDTPTTKDAAFEVYQEVAGSWKDKVLRFNPTDYSLVDSFTYPATTPDQLHAFDGKFYLGYDSTNKRIVKFGISNGSLAEASTQNIQETVVSTLSFNNFINFVYALGTTLVAVPVSI